MARKIDDDEQQDVNVILKLFNELTTYRNVFAGQWEEAAGIGAPDYRNTFFYGSYNFPGTKKTQQQVDGTIGLALQQFCAIADSLITPKNRKWHALESDDYVMQDRATRQWFDDVRAILFDYRYRPEGNFVGQNFSNWKMLGAFGNSIMYVDALDTRWTGGRPGLRYKSAPLGQCFFAENHQGIVTTMCRWWRMTAPQAVEKFGLDWLPAQLEPALEQKLQQPYQFIHCVKPREIGDFDPDRLDHKGMPFSSHYISIEGKCLMAPEGGYREFPYAVSRYDQMPDEVYGRGPLQLTLPAGKTLNAQKATQLKVAHRNADPVYLVPEDGIIDFSQVSGALNKGGVNADGRPMVHTLAPGDHRISIEMMQEERSLIEAHFLTSLFKVLTENPNMTATQVVELLNERGMLVAPTLGRQFSEYVNGLTRREYSILSNSRRRDGRPIIPPMPPRLREAMGHWWIKDTTPLADMARAGEAAGGLRTLDVANQVAERTGDVSVYDHFNFDRMIPDIGQINSMPTVWASTPQQLQAKRQDRAARAQQEQAIQALPAKAAMIKANAVAAKAGQTSLAAQQQPQPVPV